jgi:hypothetical protein
MCSYELFIAQIQSGNSYEDDDMYLLPWVKGKINKSTLFADDESVYGESFKNIPVRTNTFLQKTITINIDTVSLGAILTALYIKDNTLAKLSVGFLDRVAFSECSSVMIQSITINGSVGEMWTADLVFVGPNVVRNSDKEYAAYTAFDSPIPFHSSVFKIGDTADALSDSDKLNITNFSLEINNRVELLFDNNVEAVTPVFSSPNINASFSCRETDSLYTWLDAYTPLQAILRLSSSKYIDFKLPRFIIENIDIDSNNLTGVTAKLRLGRNGIDGSYKNSNMSFNDPINIIVEE